MTLSIVIVNWNSKEHLRKCLDSLAAHAHELAPQVIVVDSGSFDGCGEMLARDFPRVEFIQSSKNVGFGRANNLALDRITGRNLLLLNPDTEILPGSLQALLSEFDQWPMTGIAGPRLLNSDGSLQTSVQALPKPVRQAFDSEILRRLLWPLGYWAPPTHYVPRQAMEVEAVSGACMLLRTETFRIVGGFTHQYFMYAEDMDLCFKVACRGMRIVHVPCSEIIHHGGVSSSSQPGSVFAAVMTREALHWYMILNHSQLHAFCYRIASASAALLRMGCLLPTLMFGRKAAREGRALELKNWLEVFFWGISRRKWARLYSSSD